MSDPAVMRRVPRLAVAGEVKKKGEWMQMLADCGDAIFCRYSLPLLVTSGRRQIPKARKRRGFVGL